MSRGRARTALLGTCLGLAGLFAGPVAVGELGDIEMDRRSSANGLPPVVFPHWAHRVRYRCYACHPHPFGMSAGSNVFSLADIRAGRFCGECHDGRTAFAVEFDTCRTCHSAESR